MEDTDLFNLSDEDRKALYRYDQMFISNNRQTAHGSKPMIFIHLSRDQQTDSITDIGAFLPEKVYCSDSSVVNNSSYTRRSKDSGWVSFHIPVNLDQYSHNWNNNDTCVMKALNFLPVQFRYSDNKYLRCKNEHDALHTFLQYLIPIKFCLGGVTIVTFSERDIKYLLHKISEFSLTQLFFNCVTDFLTIMGVVSLPTVPGSLSELLSKHYPDITRLSNSSAGCARAMAYVFALNHQSFRYDGDRKEFSVLEEYFTMNYEVKLDEGNEENLHLYIGDLAQQVRDEDLIDIICDKTGLQGSEFRVKMCYHPHKAKQFLGYCYVQFKQHDAALRTLSRMNNEMLYGKAMRVVWHNKTVVGGTKSNANLYIKNAPKSMDQKQLHEIFCVFGKVHSCKVQTDGDGFHTGVAFVQFDQDISAHRAIKAMHGIPVPGQAYASLYVSIKQTSSERKGGASSLHPSSVPPQISVNVEGNFGAVDLESVFQKFNSYGDVEFIKTSKNENEKLVLLVYELTRDCEASLKENGTNFLGARLNVKIHEENRMSEFKESNVKGERLYVGNIDPLSKSDDLVRLFNQIQDGPTRPVLESKVMRNAAGNSLQYGYVTIRPEYTSQALAKFHGRNVGGYKLTVHLDEEDQDEVGGVFAKNSRASSSEATTSKATSISGVSKPKAEPKKIDSKSLMANKLMNAMRKKAKGTTATTPAKETTNKETKEYGASSKPSVSKNYLPDNIHSYDERTSYQHQQPSSRNDSTQQAKYHSQYENPQHMGATPYATSFGRGGGVVGRGGGGGWQPPSMGRGGGHMTSSGGGDYQHYGRYDGQRPNFSSTAPSGFGRGGSMSAAVERQGEKRPPRRRSTSSSSSGSNRRSRRQSRSRSRSRYGRKRSRSTSSSSSRSRSRSRKVGRSRSRKRSSSDDRRSRSYGRKSTRSRSPSYSRKSQTSRRRSLSNGRRSPSYKRKSARSRSPSYGRRSPSYGRRSPSYGRRSPSYGRRSPRSEGHSRSSSIENQYSSRPRY